MTTTALRSLSGLSSIITGALFLLAHVLNLGESNSYGTVAGETFVLIAHLLAVFAFFGLYEAQGDQKGFLGLLGMITANIGTILVTAIVYVEIAGASGAQAEVIFNEQVPGMILPFGPIMFVLGMILFSLSVIWGKILPRSGGFLLIAGTFIFAIGSLAGSAQAVLEVVGAAFTAGGFIRLGLPLMKNKKHGPPIQARELN